MCEMTPWWSPTIPVLTRPVVQIILRSATIYISSSVCTPNSGCYDMNQLQTVGFCWTTTEGQIPTIQLSTKESKSQSCPGPFKITINNNRRRRVWGRAYAINRGGVVGYSSTVTFVPTCLAAGTQIALQDGTSKPIEDLTYDDELLTWDLDSGRITSARPLWIKEPEAADTVEVLTFADGTQLRSLNHRLYSIDDGAFVEISQKLIGTRVRVLSGETTITGYHVETDQHVMMHNVLANVHMAVFADGVLTSSRFNNNLADTTSVHVDIFEPYFTGLQAARQQCLAEELRTYVDYLGATAKADGTGRNQSRTAGSCCTTHTG